MQKIGVSFQEDSSVLFTCKEEKTLTFLPFPVFLSNSGNHVLRKHYGMGICASLGLPDI